MVRLPAEWEPQSFVQFTFPHRKVEWTYTYEEMVTCFVNIIEAVAGFEPVLVVCQSRPDVMPFFNALTSYPIYFVEVDLNDVWARDHGAITVIKDGQPVLHDFIFNGWGQKFEAGLDNQITSRLAQKAMPHIGIQSHNFVLEGGSIESDGQGTLLTTTECLMSEFRNPDMSQAEIEAYLCNALGLKKVLWLDHGYLSGDDTDSHIDTLARLCSPTVIAYTRCSIENDEHHEALSRMETQLASFTNAENQPYQLIALPWPDACYDPDGMRLPATYANFLIVNGGVLVPTYGVRQDEEALNVIAKIFPDRKVIGLDCRPLIDQHGSLHCISMQYPKEVKLSIQQL